MRGNEITVEGSQAPVVGPLIDLLRKLTRPLVKIFMGSSTGDLLAPDDASIEAIYQASRT